MTDSLTDRFRFLARSNQREKTPIRAEVPEAKLADGIAVLRLYDPIDSWGEWWGVSAKEFVAALDALPDDTTEIQLHINSPGGEVFEGIAILNALRAHKARVVTIVDGLAASAASFIAMAGDEVVMARNSELMIHDAWGVCVGNAADMHKMAGELDHFSDNLADVYAAKAGGTVEQWRTAMSAETWYSADEAVDAGLADRVDAKPADDQAKNRFDLTVFAHAGRAEAPAPRTPATTSVSGSTENPEESMKLTDAQAKAVRTRLGITDENADGDIVLAALEEALSEQADHKPVPEGHVVVPEARLLDLEAGAAAGTAAAQKLHDQERETFLDSMRTKYAPANRAAWADEYDRDPEGTRKHFASAADIIAVAPLGHDEDADTAEDDALYASLFGAEKKGA